MTTAQATMGQSDLVSLIHLTRRLTDLATAEITALRAMRAKDIRPIQEEKAALATRYESELAAWKEPAASDPLVAELKEDTRTLRSVLADNKRALEAVRQINHKLVQTIASEIARRRNPGESYGESGTVRASGLTGARPVGPLKLDENV